MSVKRADTSIIHMTQFYYKLSIGIASVWIGMKYFLPFFFIVISFHPAKGGTIREILRVPEEKLGCARVMNELAVEMLPLRLQDIAAAHRITLPKLTWEEVLDNESTKASKPVAQWLAQIVDEIRSENRGAPTAKTRIVLAISLFQGLEAEPRMRLEISIKRPLNSVVDQKALQTVVDNGFIPKWSDGFRPTMVTKEQLAQLILESPQTYKEASRVRISTLNQELRDFILGHYEMILNRESHGDLPLKTLDSILKTEVIEAGNKAIVFNASVSLRHPSQAIILLFEDLKREIGL